MRKFSVLLIVVLFFIPVFVYGLTGTSLVKPVGFVKAISKFAPVANVLSLGHKDVVKPMEVNPMLPDDPFFPAPNGIRGKIVEINAEEKMIFVKDAVFFNEATKLHERADFHIYTDLATDFYVNMIPGGIFDDLQIGDEIISKGSINFNDHTSRNSVAIYKGKFVSPEEKRMVEFVGVITELDRASMKFTLPGLRDIVILLNQQSRCFQLTMNDSNELLEYIGIGTIPEWVKEGTRVRGTMIVTPEAVEFFADNIYFSKE